jgi:4-amino-4-deoxy-L-arabinose transferase-like glycosyltransferase
MTFTSFIPRQLSLAHVCCIAIMLRVAWALLIPVIPISDSVAYDTFAQNIWQHGTYGWTEDKPTAFWPVGTSAIYSVLFMLFGYGYTTIVTLNIICTVAIIFLTRALCDRFFENKHIGIYSALAIALWPTLILYTTILASELPYMAVLMAAFYLLTNKNTHIITLGISSGILFAIAYYIRPLAIIVFAIGAFYLCVYTNNKRVSILRSGLSLLVLALLVSPWAYRNYQLYDAFIPMSTNGGSTLWMGNQPGTNGGYASTPKALAHLDEHLRNQTLKKEALDYIQQEPVAFLTRTLTKFIQFHLRETIGVSWNEKGIIQVLGEKALLPLKVITQSYWSAFLLLALFGIMIMIKQKGFWRTAFHPFILMWASTAGIHAIIVSQDRYHIPITPIVSAFAVYAVIFIGSLYKKNKHSYENNELNHE